MEKQRMETQSQHGKGQTLAEFALTLPILLLLLFGIVEFGRLFQSWVTLQNAARTAVRYASTGQYKDDRFDIESLIICTPETTVNAVGADTTFVNYERGRGYPSYTIEQFVAGNIADESLYATWYGQPLGCAPGPETDQNRRDILRLPSIYEEARRGAAGLLIERSTLSPTLESLEDYLFSQFQRPSPDIDQVDWFDVVVCSSRDKLYDNNNTYIVDLLTNGPADANDTARFELVLDDPDYAPAACVLREKPIPEKEADLPDNSKKPWMDAGGPGERVTVVITFNHRLITPIGLADFVKLQAQRSAINESFRVTNAERALGPSGSPPDGLPQTPTPPAEPDTPIPTASHTLTATSTPTETAYPTDTPSPFDCENIDAFFRAVPFSLNRFYIEFANFNFEPAYLLESDIYWDKTPVEAEFPGIFMSAMALANEAYWGGHDTTPPTYANSEGTLFYDPDSNDHNVYIPSGGEKINWQGQFSNGPQNLSSYFTIYDFTGTNFVFDHPDTEEDCRIYVYTPPVPTATLEPPGYNSPTPTYTPDCASLTMRVEFVAFQVAGDVTLRIINDGPINAPFTGFNIIWPSISGVGLDKVVFGGKNALDTPPNGNGVVMWDSTVGGGDTSPPTSSTEPTFLTQVTVPAYSNTLVHLDFVGVAGKLPISPSDLNGSRFDIWCGLPGTPFGPGGGGGGNGGSIFLSNENTPVPTNLPPPTWTPLSKTFTPTNTPPPAIPTNTRTPAPTVPTNTPAPTQIPPTPTPIPDIDIGSCGVSGDKC